MVAMGTESGPGAARSDRRRRPYAADPAPGGAIMGTPTADRRGMVAANRPYGPSRGVFCSGLGRPGGVPGQRHGRGRTGRNGRVDVHD
jgi:hypothetical protein